MNSFFSYFFIILLIGFSLFSAGHAILYKRASRAGFGWVVTCLVFVGFGPIFYWLFGINRIRTHAKKIYRLGYIKHESKSGNRKRSFKSAKKDIFNLEKYRSVLNVSEKVNRHP